MYSSEQNEVPEINLKKLDHISSIITTFEQKDLKSNSTVSFYYDKNNDIVFLELLAKVNGKIIVDNIFGFDKDKILSTCENIKSFFGGEK